jgi:hypothetical protein
MQMKHSLSHIDVTNIRNFEVLTKRQNKAIKGFQLSFSQTAIKSTYLRYEYLYATNNLEFLSALEMAQQ